MQSLHLRALIDELQVLGLESCEALACEIVRAQKSVYELVLQGSGNVCLLISYLPSFDHCKCTLALVYDDELEAVARRLTCFAVWLGDHLLSLPPELGPLSPTSPLTQLLATHLATPHRPPLLPMTQAPLGLGWATWTGMDRSRHVGELVMDVVGLRTCVGLVVFNEHRTRFAAVHFADAYLTAADALKREQLRRSEFAHSHLALLESSTLETFVATVCQFVGRPHSAQLHGGTPQATPESAAAMLLHAVHRLFRHASAQQAFDHMISLSPTELATVKEHMVTYRDQLPPRAEALRFAHTVAAWPEFVATQLRREHARSVEEAVAHLCHLLRQAGVQHLANHTFRRERETKDAGVTMRICSTARGYECGTVIGPTHHLSTFRVPRPLQMCMLLHVLQALPFFESCALRKVVPSLPALFALAPDVERTPTAHEYATAPLLRRAVKMLRTRADASPQLIDVRGNVGPQENCRTNVLEADRGEIVRGFKVWLAVKGGAVVGVKAVLHFVLRESSRLVSPTRETDDTILFVPSSRVSGRTCAALHMTDAELAQFADVHGGAALVANTAAGRAYASLLHSLHGDDMVVVVDGELQLKDQLACVPLRFDRSRITTEACLRRDVRAGELLVIDEEVVAVACDKPFIFAGKVWSKASRAWHLAFALVNDCPPWVTTELQAEASLELLADDAELVAAIRRAHKSPQALFRLLAIVARHMFRDGERVWIGRASSRFKRAAHPNMYALTHLDVVVWRSLANLPAGTELTVS